MVQESSSWKYITTSWRVLHCPLLPECWTSDGQELSGKENEAESCPLSPHQSHPSHHPISSLRLCKPGGWRRDGSQGQKIMGEDRQIFWISGSQTWLPIGSNRRDLNILMPESYPPKFQFHWSLVWSRHQDFIKLLGRCNQGWEPLSKVVCIQFRRKKGEINLW